MQRFRVSELLNLLAATEAVSYKDRCGAGGSDCGEQVLAGNCARHFEFVGFKSKGSCHAAASCLDRLDRRAGLSKNRNFACRSAKDGLVMAMAVNKNVRPLESP